MITGTAAKNRYALGEVDILLGTLKSDQGKQPRGIVFCHGSGDTAESAAHSFRFQFNMLAKRALVHIGDLAFQHWAADPGINRVRQAISELHRRGVTGKVALLGMSMGAGLALNYANRYPEDVECLALTIPLTDLNDARANPYLSTRWPEMDALYPNGKTGDWQGHNPIEFAATMDAALPIKIWHSTDDPLARPAPTAAFLAARPQTESQSMGAVAHTVPRSFFREIEQFLSEHLPDREPAASPLSITGAAPVAQLTETGDLTSLGIPADQGITLYAVADLPTTADAYGVIAYLAGPTGMGTNPVISIDTGPAGGTVMRARWDGAALNQTVTTPAGVRSGKRVMVTTLSADGLTGTLEVAGAAEVSRALAGGFGAFARLRLITPTASTKPIAVHAYTGVHTPAVRKAVLAWLAAEHNAVPPL